MIRIINSCIQDLKYKSFLWNERAYHLMCRFLKKRKENPTNYSDIDGYVNKELKAYLMHEFSVKGRYDPELTVLLMLINCKDKIKHILQDNISYACICLTRSKIEEECNTNLYLIDTHQHHH